jgi:hypothetical protein
MLGPDGLGPDPGPPGGGRGGWRLVAGVLAVAVLGGVGWWVGGHPGLGTGTTGAATPTVPVATATVQRQDLKGQTKLSGSLGYAGGASVQSPLSGRVTWLPTTGAVIGRGGALLLVDNTPVQLFSGHLPAWRDLAVGVGDGPDIRPAGTQPGRPGL